MICPFLKIVCQESILHYLSASIKIIAAQSISLMLPYRNYNLLRIPGHGTNYGSFEFITNMSSIFNAVCDLFDFHISAVLLFCDLVVSNSSVSHNFLWLVCVCIVLIQFHYSISFSFSLKKHISNFLIASSFNKWLWRD